MAHSTVQAEQLLAQLKTQFNPDKPEQADLKTAQATLNKLRVRGRRRVGGGSSVVVARWRWIRSVDFCIRSECRC